MQTGLETAPLPSQSARMLRDLTSSSYLVMKVRLKFPGLFLTLRSWPKLVGGLNSLHGGDDGFDRRVWQTTKVSSNSVTFVLLDPNGMEGFPGTVVTTVCLSQDFKIPLFALT